MEPSDGELVLAAQAGDAESLTALLMRHRAAMHAVAVAMLGPGPDVEDVVQDASLVALTGIGRIRDPSLARSWLTGTTRNLARARIRRREPLPADLTHLPAPDDLDRRIEEAALRDWVWEAMGGLSEPLHDVVVLRYFSEAASYDTIAATLGIPVGTVRSRLYDARRALVARLRALDTAAADDHSRVTREREEQFTAIVDEYNLGQEPALLAGALADGARLTAAGTDAVFVGPTAIARSLAEDLEAGVQLTLLRVVAGVGLTVVEGIFRNPTESPDHCPPLTTQIYRHRGEEIVSLHLTYSSG
ncbi:RNA polymerase sigma factor [Nocardioides speluncae]|uniref:RNA polymerase sigma factor n=1 Tax=Nocardioides speluncae TaxID=2670337 RepID=UPI000D68EECC|nr:RNA polymerase sigma factor [Nocardioides speluncae]